MSNEARRRLPDAMNNVFVETTRAKRAFARLDELLARTEEEQMCFALAVLGPSGSGKTRVCQEWIRRRRTAAGGDFHALIVEVPAGCTLKALAAEILMMLGDPDPDYGSQPDRTRRIGDLAAAQRIDLLFIDEVQRFIDADSGKVKKDIANWLTGLVNRNVCPLVLVGERHAELVFEGNVYLERRTLGEVPMEPYDWHDTIDRMEFRAFLQLAESELGLPEKSGLSETDVAMRIHGFSLGRIGLATRLLSEARSLARLNGKTHLTRALLADAVDLLRIGRAKAEPNPFRVEIPTPHGTPIEVRDDIVPQPRRRGKEASQ